LHIDQPQWSELTTIDDAQTFSDTVGYPVLVRPSYVLSGASMYVACSWEELVGYLELAEKISKDKPVVISKYIVNAKEIEFDAVSQQGEILNYAISEHVENAGVHSGDATLVLPAQKLYVQTVRKVKQISAMISRSLQISGPFNIQFLAVDNAVKVIECNLRASRTFPFISKTLDVNFISLATKVMLGYECKPFHISLYDFEYVAVKAPIFSFARLRGADPTLGVEMSSTGEVACFGHDLHEAFLLALMATDFKLPTIGNNKYILVSITDEKMRLEFQSSLGLLINMGYQIACTFETAISFLQKGISNIKSLQASTDNNDNNETNEEDSIQIDLNKKIANSPISWIKNKQIDLVINISEGNSRRDEINSGYRIRRTAVDFGVSLITNIKCANLLCEAIYRKNSLPCKSIEEFLYPHKQRYQN